MNVFDAGGVGLHYREDGDPSGAPVVFANSLGTDLRLWDGVLPHLPPGLRIIRYDKRGHGLSDCPEAPYAMGALVSDIERLLMALDVRECLFVGLSIGGLIAQGLAAKRLDLVRALVLSNTGAKIATREIWQDRIDTIRRLGMPVIGDATMKRWFSKGFRERPELAAWRNMLISTPAEGYIGCATAIQGTDFFTPTSTLRLPALGIAGDEDAATPPDLVRETLALIPGSRTELMRRAGHLPCVEDPVGYARLLTAFMREIGHL
ncbi:MAG: 3-oxoadipate enol-lactonase [Pseudomonadota bacterium]